MTRRPKVLCIAGLALAIAILVIDVMLCIVAVQAACKGATQGQLESMSPAEAASASDATPTATRDIDADGLHGKVAVLYRFGCADCEAVYADLRADLPANMVVYVPVDSDAGRLLAERKGISEVPALVAFAPGSGIYAVSPVGEDGSYDREAAKAAIRYAKGE